MTRPLPHWEEYACHDLAQSAQKAETHADLDRGPAAAITPGRGRAPAPVVNDAPRLTGESTLVTISRRARRKPQLMRISIGDQQPLPYQAADERLRQW